MDAVRMQFEKWVSFHTGHRRVVLVPRDAPFVATSYDRAGDPPSAVCVDITTAPVVDDCTVTAVDLDLDVIRGWTGRVWVDDEDEFAAHRTKRHWLAELAAAMMQP